MEKEPVIFGDKWHYQVFTSESLDADVVQNEINNMLNMLGDIADRADPITGYRYCWEFKDIKYTGSEFITAMLIIRSNFSIDSVEDIMSRLPAKH